MFKKTALFWKGGIPNCPECRCHHKLIKKFGLKDCSPLPFLDSANQTSFSSSSFHKHSSTGFCLGKYCFSFFLRIGLMCVCLQLSPLLLLTTIKRSISIVNIKNNDIFFNDIGVYLYQIIVFSLCIISSHLTDGSCLGLLARLQLVASLLDKARMEQDIDFRNNHTSYLSRIPRIYQCKFFWPK